MFILLVLILTVISISLRLGASGAELAVKVSERANKIKTDDVEGSAKNLIKGVVRVGLATSTAFMKLSAFIVARIRDMIGITGSFVMIFELIIILNVAICVSSYVVLFGEETGIVTSPTSHSYSSLSGIDGLPAESVSKPDGLSEASWNSADVVGKLVVAFACNSITNPPNGKYLIYSQGDTDVGYSDCSTFVCATLEGSLHKTFAGLDAPNGYDFAVNKKSDLKSYKSTSSMQHTIDSKKSCIVGSTDSDLEFAKPGDILLKDGHVGIYVGVNENGENVMVHASSHSDPYCNGDINLADGQKLDVGFSTISGTFTIIRTSALLGFSDSE